MAAPVQRLSRLGCRHLSALPARSSSQGWRIVVGAHTRGGRGTVRAQKQEPEGRASRGGRSAAAAGLVLLSLVDLGLCTLPARADAAASPVLEEAAAAKVGDVGPGVEEALVVGEHGPEGVAEAGDTEDAEESAEEPARPREAGDAKQQQVPSASVAASPATSEPSPVEALSEPPLTLDEVHSPALGAPVLGVPLEVALQGTAEHAAPVLEAEGALSLAAQANEDAAPTTASEESDGAHRTVTPTLAAGDSEAALPSLGEALPPDSSTEASGPGSGQTAVAVAVSALSVAALAVSRLLGLTAKQEELKDELSKAERQVREGRRLLMDMQALVAAQAQEAETVVSTLRASCSKETEALQAKLQETNALLKRLTAELSTSSEEGGRMQARIEEQEASISQLKRQLEERSVTIASLGAEMQEQQVELEKTEQALAQAQEALAQAQQEAEDRAQALDEALQSKASLEKQLREQLRLAQAAPSQVAELEQQAVTLQAQLQAAASETQAREQKLVELEQALGAERKATANFEKQVAAQAQQVATADERVRSLTARVQRMEEELAAKEIERAAIALRVQEKTGAIESTGS